MVEATTASLKERAKLLHSERAAAEQRVQAIAAQLDSMPGKPGLQGKLVDAKACIRHTCIQSRVIVCGAMLQRLR